MLVQIEYELKFDAPFHFGTGVTAGLIDRTVIRDAKNFLYVPASTFKGVLREHCEQLSRFYLPHIPVASPHNTYAALGQFGKAPSLISRIFGSSLYPGSLRFNDARQEEGIQRAYEYVQTSDATQARIDRVTRTAVDDALYTSEFGTRYLIFRGAIRGQLDDTPIASSSLPAHAEQTNVPTPTYALMLLLAGILMIERLGGNKSTGKGQCRCVIGTVHLDGKSCSKDVWQSWIEHLDVLSTYPGNQEGGQG